MKIHIRTLDKRGVRSTKEIHEKDAKIEGFFLREKSGGMKQIRVPEGTTDVIIQLKDEGPLSEEVKGKPV